MIKCYTNQKNNNKKNKGILISSHTVLPEGLALK